LEIHSLTGANLQVVSGKLSIFCQIAPNNPKICLSFYPVALVLGYTILQGTTSGRKDQMEVTNLRIERSGLQIRTNATSVLWLKILSACVAIMLWIIFCHKAPAQFYLPFVNLLLQFLRKTWQPSC
jgi:hypothetical protein